MGSYGGAITKKATAQARMSESDNFTVEITGCGIRHFQLDGHPLTKQFVNANIPLFIGAQQINFKFEQPTHLFGTGHSIKNKCINSQGGSDRYTSIVFRHN